MIYVGVMRVVHISTSCSSARARASYNNNRNNSNKLEHTKHTGAPRVREYATDVMIFNRWANPYRNLGSSLSWCHQAQIDLVHTLICGALLLRRRHFSASSLRTRGRHWITFCSKDNRESLEQIVVALVAAAAVRSLINIWRICNLWTMQQQQTLLLR